MKAVNEAKDGTNTESDEIRIEKRKRREEKKKCEQKRGRKRGRERESECEKGGEEQEVTESQSQWIQHRFLFMEPVLMTHKATGYTAMVFDFLHSFASILLLFQHFHVLSTVSFCSTRTSAASGSTSLAKAAAAGLAGNNSPNSGFVMNSKNSV